MPTRRILVPLLSLLAWLLAACGDNIEPVDTGVESIMLSASQTTLMVGASQQITATAHYADGSTKNVSADATWTSSAPAVATVAAGNITGVAAGTAQVTCAYQGQSATVTVTVSAVALTRIDVTPPAPRIAAGLEVQLTATGVFQDNTTRDISAQVTWTSSAAATATVSATGEVEGLVAGTATITATANGISGSIEVTVTDAELVAIQVTPAAPSIGKGATQPMTATGMLTDGTTPDLTEQVIWSSSAPAVATVSSAADSEGVVTAIEPGTATITASLNGISGTATVTVTDAVLVSIAITSSLPAPPSLAAGTETQLTATGTYSDATTRDVTAEVTWTSSAPPVATVSDDAATRGLLRGVAVGTSTISAALGEVEGALEVTITDATLRSIAVTPVEPSLAAGTSIQLTAVGTFSDDSTQVLTTQVLWSSSDAAATVSNAVGSEGVVTGARVGTAPITATFGSGPEAVSATTTVTVTAAALRRIVVTPLAPSVAAGRSVRLTATGIFTDASTQDLTDQVGWASSATSVATVAADGLVETLIPGDAMITATSGSVVGSTVVTVTAAVLAEIQVTPTTPTVAIGFQQAFTATGIFSDRTTQNLTDQVTWASSQASVATISNADGSRGLAEGLVAGPTSISATLEGVTGSTTLTVSTATLASIEVAPAEAEMPDGTTRTFTATGVFSDASRQDISARATWESSAPATASVSNAPGERGLVTAIEVGPATISAALRGVSGTSAVTVTPAALVSIAVTPVAEQLPLGLTLPLTATGTYTDASTLDITAQVTWESSSPTSVEISNADDSRGVARALALGPATITATLDGIRGTATVTATPALLRSIAVTPAEATVPQGATQAYVATGTFSDASTAPLTNATWSSSDTAIATISNDNATRGVATAVATTGTATIRAEVGAISATATFTAAPPVLASVVVTPAVRHVPDGFVIPFRATAVLTNRATSDVTATATWAVGDAAIAALSSASVGVVTATGPGETPVTAQFEGVTGTAVLTVAATRACTATPSAGTLVDTVRGSDARCYAGVSLAASTSWDAARAACQGAGGDLVVIDSARENELARLALPASTAAWIGYTDSASEAEASAGLFVDVTGTAIGSRFQAFGTGEPNNAGAGEDCVAFSRTEGPGRADQWLDLDCAQTDVAVPVGGAVCEITSPKLVINEVDYDQPEGDLAEFIEILNAGSAPASLVGVRLVLINGSNSQTYTPTFDLAPLESLAPGQVLVIGSENVIRALPPEVPGDPTSIKRLQFGPGTVGAIQNGSPDGLILVQGTAAACTALDSLSYEGPITAAVVANCTGTFSLVEGTALPASVADAGSPGSLSRTGGIDTDNSAEDWTLTTLATPGVATPGL